MIRDKDTEILMNFGLSFLQAKLYLNLPSLKKADVKTISKASNIARQDVYRIMPSLERMGLAAKILDGSTFYEAVPIKEGCAILLHNKKEECVDLEKKIAVFLLDNFQLVIT